MSQTLLSVRVWPIMAPPGRPSKRPRRTPNQSDHDAGEATEDPASPPAPAPAPASSGSPVVVFAHGAGAPSTSDWMLRWKGMLEEALGAAAVITFDYPYISARRAPPKAEKLVDHHLSVVKDAVEKYPEHPLILVGKSMGSRVGCMVAGSEDINVSAIICLGYPLKGMNGAIRDETLLQLRAPTMFVQGSKDSLCPLEKLEATRKKMKCSNELHVVDGGDHSFKIGKKFQQSSGVDQDEAERMAVKAISEFVSKVILEAKT